MMTNRRIFKDVVLFSLDCFLLNNVNVKLGLFRGYTNFKHQNTGKLKYRVDTFYSMKVSLFSMNKENENAIRNILLLSLSGHLPRT